MHENPKVSGVSELLNAKTSNMAVAQHFGIVKEYSEMLQKARKLNKQELEKNGEKAELNLIYTVRYNLHLFVKTQIDKSMI